MENIEEIKVQEFLDYEGLQVLAQQINDRLPDPNIRYMVAKDPKGTGNLSINGTASGGKAASIGDSNTASGAASFAEGRITKASGIATHAEGQQTNASGFTAHAEGGVTEALGNYSHAEGRGTIAAGQYQHVQGKFNVEDTNDEYAHIVGGGSQSERKNIHTLDWEGNAKYTGDVIATKEDGTEVSLLNHTHAGGGAPTLVDDVTGIKYALKISNGQLYVEELD